MITVAGEALIDLIVDPAGHVDPRFGGGPFNVARAVARLGQPAAFLGRLSGDRFGRLLRADLDRHGVLAAIEAPADAPTTLAMVDVDPAGVPGYHFYLAGTAAAAIGPAQAVLPAGTAALHIGSLGLVMEPAGTSMEHLVATLPGGVTVMLDPNCRPGAIASRQAYLDRLDRILRRVDMIKTSTEDLAYLFPGQGTEYAAAELLGQGPACVVITDGAATVRAFAAGHEIRADVPAANIVDTVGAGDAFGGAFLSWWMGNGLGQADFGEPDAVRSATQAAIYASVVTCTRRGAEPPWAYELAGHDGWRWLPPGNAHIQPDQGSDQGSEGTRSSQAGRF
jgi:fructokinase